MPDLNLDIDFFSHPKTKRLVRLLGKGSEVLPIKLWCYTAHYFAMDGILTGISTEEIESEIGWWGKASAMVEALSEVGFVHVEAGTIVVHDWKDREGHLHAYHLRAKAGAAKRWGNASGNANGNASSNATSIPKGNAPTNVLTNLPTNSSLDAQASGEMGEVGGGDPVREYWRKHPGLPPWSPKMQGDLELLLARSDWATVDRLIDAAIAKNASCPASYALGILQNEERQRASKPKSTPRGEWENKPFAPQAK